MKHILWLGVIAFLLGSATPVIAHPADSIAVALDSSYFLTVEVRHPVKQWPGDHYIGRVTVALNGKIIITQTLSSQSSQEWQYVYYRLIDAKKGDKIRVTAECNIYGKLAVDYVVPDLTAGGG